MAYATLTSGLTATTTYTSLAVTAMPTAIALGENVWVDIGNVGVEPFVTSSAVSIGATAIPVVSRAASSNHSIGAPVAPQHVLTGVGRTASPLSTPRGHRI